MVPNKDIDLTNVETIPYATKTYGVDLQTKRILNTVDSLEAIKQSVIKILMTERFAYEIYDENYGNELSSLIGKDSLFVKNNLKRLIEESLFADDRISSIENFTINDLSKDTMEVSFTAITSTQETLNIKQEVRIS